jgi:hypothetical protein
MNLSLGINNFVPDFQNYSQAPSAFVSQSPISLSTCPVVGRPHRQGLVVEMRPSGSCGVKTATTPR